MNGSYLIPANAKKGTLIFNLFRPIDLIIFGTGIGVSLILLLFTSGTNMVSVIISCLPAGATGLLVLPIPNYHNVLCAIQSILNYYNGRKRYYWKGWCFYEQFAKEYKHRK